MPNWSDWMNAGAKVKIIYFGDGSTTISTATKSGSSGNWTFVNTITTDDTEVVEMFTSGRDVKCAVVSNKYRYGFASATGGFISTISIEATESDSVVTITLTEHSTTTVTPNYKNITELTVLFVAE